MEWRLHRDDRPRLGEARVNSRGGLCAVASFDLFACLYWRWRFGSASSRERRATDLVYAIIPNGISGPEIHVQ